jgi:outer membrane protein TolC
MISLSVDDFRYNLLLIRKMMSSGKAAAALFLFPAVATAQNAIPLTEAVERAQKSYPSVQVTLARVDAAIAGILLARTSYLPRVDTLAQANRATRNNIYGMLLQQPVISPISGPPVLENSATSVFGSAIGVLVDWEPFDFGLRKSRVDLSESTRRRADASVARSRFDAATAAADSYLTILAAQETARAARASVERSRVLLNSIDALVRAELRPGADAAVARSELAAAETQLVRGEQAIAESKAVLAGLIGEQPNQITVSEGRLLALPEESIDAPGQVTQNPAAQEQSAVVDEAKARLATFDHAWVPRFSVQGTTYARGTGARPDFTTRGGANGLAPTFYNWGLGFTVRFPLLDQAPIRAQQAEQAANVRSEESRYRLVVVELETRRNRALAALEAARRIARLAPTQLEAARTAETQAQARYKAGLATIMEVADAQRVLAQAEIDDGLARLSVWRSLLSLRSAEGDLTPLLQMAGR